MREVGRAAGWLLFEYEERYYVRVEELVAFLSRNDAASAILAQVLRDDLSVVEDDAGV